MQTAFLFLVVVGYCSLVLATSSTTTVNTSSTQAPQYCMDVRCPPGTTGCKIHKKTTEDLQYVNVTVQCINFNTHQTLAEKNSTEPNPFLEVAFEMTNVRTFFSFE